MNELKQKLQKIEGEIRLLNTALTYNIITESELEKLIELEHEKIELEKLIKSMIETDPEFIKSQYVINSIFSKVSQIK